MAFFLTPRYAPAQFSHCNRLAYAPVQPVQRYVIRPRVHPLAPFAGYLDNVLSELDREVRREVVRQRRQHKQLVRAHFVLNENEASYQIDGELPMFEQDNITIEVTDAHTVKVAGNTEQKSEQPEQAPAQAVEATPSRSDEADVTEPVNITEGEASEARSQSPAPSETGSNKSYQATVEDDFEDLGAEMSSVESTIGEMTTIPQEPKGKEKAIEPKVVTTSTQPHEEAAPAEDQQQEPEERVNYTFERNFRFAERIDGANVTASFKNGLLSIVVPKAKAPELRRIQIQ